MFNLYECTVRKANGKLLHAIGEHDAQVRLVPYTTFPSMKGRVVETQFVDSGRFCGSFIPAKTSSFRRFRSMHPRIPESVGKAYIPYKISKAVCAIFPHNRSL